MNVSRIHWDNWIIADSHRNKQTKSIVCLYEQHSDGIGCERPLHWEYLTSFERFQVEHVHFFFCRLNVQRVLWFFFKWKMIKIILRKKTTAEVAEKNNCTNLKFSTMSILFIWIRNNLWNFIFKFHYRSHSGKEFNSYKGRKQRKTTRATVGELNIVSHSVQCKRETAQE